MAMLELKDVMISYGGVPTVQSFHLSLEEGEICSIVGESGSGKTTVIRAVLGLLPGGGKVTRGISSLKERRFWINPKKNGGRSGDRRSP